MSDQWFTIGPRRERRRARLAATGSRHRHGDRCPHRAAVPNQPAVQCRRAAGYAWDREHRLPAHQQARRAAGASQGYGTVAQRVLGEPQFPQFRRLRDDRRVPDGTGRAAIIEGRHTCALMCAEAVWWRCYRRIITDYLIAVGEPVVHILGQGHLDAASMTPGAQKQADGTLIYPPEEGA